MTRGAQAVEKAIREANKRGEAALIPFIEGGDPDFAATEDLLWALAEAGADVIELGFPFSDPLADGPIIQEAAQRALRHQPTIDQFLDLIARLRQEGFKVPVVIMGYLNPFFRYGLEAFAQNSHQSGLDGAIIPDLPLEEAKPWLKIARKHRLASILLAAPTTPSERLERIARSSTGFLYYVSITGITGTKEALPEELALKLDLAREVSPVPVAVGFGISKPEQVKALSPHADAIVVGSAIVKLIAEHEGEKSKLPEIVGRFVKELKEATRR
ncbi:tryptophan synthase subunit alpha [Thermodesulfatator autotrophicus]|uniref:Tryptophan synthase alpha chain n=1 Tax=Thermodesulfatator autotrophicus TaxID=1795632 RepID=A0A177E8R5_9BACT|nr:tryptophan synthase subunit alpha [Thermodesulfatator autotrophicus]OAG28096.1 tryptophan synthase subunit alpha [Thermodesulfatator autotrophicus]